MSPELSEKLRIELGDLLLPATARTEPYAGDQWLATHAPDAVVLPGSESDVVKILRFAHAHGVPVTPRGAGVGYVGGCVPICGGIVLSTERMNRILELNTADGIAIVEPGVITADLQSACAAAGWYYPPDPASCRNSSIGGNIATNAGGPRCLKYGVTRSYVLGLRVVSADGRAFCCGGRTHKNKQGFDLAGLYCGSEGMLGVITQATLRIIPAPESRMALQASFRHFGEAAHAVQTVLQTGHLPCALEIADAFTLSAARRHLGTDALPSGAKGHLILEIDGRRDALSLELADLQDLLQRAGALHVRTAQTETEVDAVWELRRGFSDSLRATDLTKLNEDVVVPRSQLVDFVRFCENLSTCSAVPIACFGHAGDGNIHTNIMVPRTEDGTEHRAEAEALLPRLFEWVLTHGGSITGEHGIGLAKAAWFRDAIGSVAFDIHRTLKQALDPTGILNPGKMSMPTGNHASGTLHHASLARKAHSSK